MINLTTMIWTPALVALGAGTLFCFARLREARNLRLMRCPESGSIALVAHGPHWGWRRNTRRCYGSIVRPVARAKLLRSRLPGALRRDRAG